MEESYISLGFLDKNGKQIHLDDRVRNPDGFVGRVIFRNLAYRVELEEYPGMFLDQTSSLLFGNWRPSDFEVVE